MSKVGGSDSAGLTPIEPGKYQAVITNAFEHHSSYQGGAPKDRVLVEIELQEVTWDDGSKRTLWEFVTAGLNPKVAKHSGTKFFRKLYGRDLTDAEVKDVKENFDYAYLIGVKCYVTLGTFVKDDGTEVNDVRAITLVSPKTPSVEAFRALWEKNGKPQGERKERYPDSLVDGFVDAEPERELVAAGAEAPDF